MAVTKAGRIGGMVFGALAMASPLAGQADSAAFVVRMGRDTLAVERFVRAGDRLTGELVRRDNPATATRDYTAELNPDGSARRLVVRLHTIGLDPAPLPYTFTYDFAADSASVLYERGAEREASRIATGGPVVPALGYSAGLLEAALRLGRHARLDSVRVVPVSGRAGAIGVRASGDSLLLATPEGPAVAWVDGAGRLVRFDGTRTLTKVTYERVPWSAVDVPALAADFARRDHERRGIGSLSPRDSLSARIGAANVSVGYGRPSMRGRKIFGGILPWGQVWRTGANITTQLHTDADLRIGGTVISAGHYSLYTIPEPGRWTLVVNRSIGVSGREDEYDATKDVARIPMQFRTLTAPVETLTLTLDAAGVLRVAWETTEAQVSITPAR